MKPRFLDPSEWHRLERPQIPPLFPYVNPGDMAVIAIEDDAGEIVACVSALKVTHFESLWVHPDYRGNAGVGRALLRYTIAIAKAWGANWAFGDIESEQMKGFVERLGGVPVPVQFYAVPLISREEAESWPLRHSSV